MLFLSEWGAASSRTSRRPQGAGGPKHPSWTLELLPEASARQASPECRAVPWGSAVSSLGGPQSPKGLQEANGAGWTPRAERPGKERKGGDSAPTKGSSLAGVSGEQKATIAHLPSTARPQGA